MPKTKIEFITTVGRKIDNYLESRPGFVDKSNPDRLNILCFPEFWHNQIGKDEYDGSKTIPSSWIRDVLDAIQIKTQLLLDKTNEQHVVAINLVSHQADEHDNTILMEDEHSGGRKRPQVSNNTFAIDPVFKQSFAKSAPSNIDNLGDVGNFKLMHMADNKDDETRGYLKLLSGGHFFYEMRICLDATKSFEETWWKRPDLMLVLSGGTPPKGELDVSYNPYALYIADTFWSRGMGSDIMGPVNGIHYSPEYSGYQTLEANEKNKTSFVGNFLNLFQAYTSVSMETLRAFCFGSKSPAKKYLYGGVPRVIEHKSDKYGTEVMFVLTDIEFKSAFTEKDLQGAATFTMDNKLYYTQPKAKE